MAQTAVKRSLLTHFGPRGLSATSLRMWPRTLWPPMGQDRETILDPNWAKRPLGHAPSLEVLKTIAGPQGPKGLSAIFDQASLAHEDPSWSP
ncbi:hypothetical protein CRG98_025989 [Punica granatum]|uniref:Uncharacterized protein n=1 Tax=Punica granatum TaxID=22663 RepID=A0A2I0JBJ3_PUNGR|nr:hypothetical protein CRG98_025989 [Punica granatum]